MATIYEEALNKMSLKEKDKYILATYESLGKEVALSLEISQIVCKKCPSLPRYEDEHARIMKNSHLQINAQINQMEKCGISVDSFREVHGKIILGEKLPKSTLEKLTEGKIE